MDAKPVKDIRYRISWQATDGTLGTCEPSWWEGDMQKLVERLEKIPDENWRGGGIEARVILYRKMAHVKVERTIVETVKEFGRRVDGKTLYFDGRNLVLNEEETAELRAVVSRMYKRVGTKEGA